MSAKRTKKTKADATQAPKEKRERFERHLRVILTKVQVEEYADRAAHLLSEMDDREESLKVAAKQAKAEIESLAARMRELSGYVRDKAKYQDVECERVFDYARGTVTETRSDTGEQLSERAMTDAERQLALDLDKDDDAERGLDDDFEGSDAE
jgi:hypothetical protein